MQSAVTSNQEQYKISQFNEPYLYSVSRNTFERTPCKSAYDNFFKDSLAQESYFYVILGTDSGLLVDYIIEQGLPYNAKFVFVDLPHVLEVISSQLTFTQWHDDVVLCTFDQWQEQANNLKLQAYLFTDKVKYVKSIAATDAYNTDYNDLDNELTLALEANQYRAMVSISKAPFFTRQLENLSENSLPIVDFKNHFLDKTCVILGGGPSLDEHIDWIKDNHDKFIIIAVSRIAKKLIAEQLVPHIIISVDPHHVSFDVSKEMLNMPTSVLFAHSSYVVPTLAGQWGGKSLFFAERIPWKNKVDQPNIQFHGPTVTNAGITMALELGFKQILLTGVDMCFASNGETHAKGSNETKVGPMLGNKGQWVKTYSGKNAETMSDFIHAATILVEQGQMAKSRNAELINLSENAAEIENIAHIPCHEISLNSQESVAKLIADIPARSLQAEVKANKKLLEEINRVIKAVNDIKRIAEQALKDNHALYLDYKDQTKNHRFKLKLDKAEKKLNGKLADINTFVMSYGLQHFIETVETDTEHDWSDEKMEETGRVYYQSYLDTIKDVSPLLLAAKKRITSRLEEEKPTPNFSLLFEQWREDKHFGRAKLWRDTHPTLFQTCSNDIKQAFDVLINEHENVIENADTAHLRRTQLLSSIDGVNRKAVYLFKQKNIDGLQHLVKNLTPMISEKAEAQAFIDISAGYQCVLQEQYAAALNHFENVPEQWQNEDEILQLVSLSIKLEQYYQAESYLKRLSDLSETYHPKYAALLKLNNKVPEAIEVYTQYLEGNPQDVQTCLAFGKLLVSVNEFAAAQTVFSMVLAVEPNNSYAQQQMNSLPI